jgi:hypothetical protein
MQNQPPAEKIMQQNGLQFTSVSLSDILFFLMLVASPQSFETAFKCQRRCLKMWHFGKENEHLNILAWLAGP